MGICASLVSGVSHRCAALTALLLDARLKSDRFSRGIAGLDLKVGNRVKLIGEKEDGIHEVLEVKAGAFRTAFKPATDKVFV